MTHVVDGGDSWELLLVMVPHHLFDSLCVKIENTSTKYKWFLSLILQFHTAKTNLKELKRFFFKEKNLSISTKFFNSKIILVWENCLFSDWNVFLQIGDLRKTIYLFLFFTYLEEIC